jgi:uncharacterized protein
MKKYLLLSTLFVAIFVLGGCDKSDQKIGMPNPASKHCSEAGGNVEIRDEQNGQVGYCVFNDGSECEEWAYFRGECKKGDNKSQNNNGQNNNSGNNNNNNENNRSNNVPKDEASSFCEKSGGKIQTQTRTLNGKDYGTYDTCIFTDNMQCEDWALFHGYCPKNGIKITGYDNGQEVYCAVLGAQVDMQNKLCKFSNGAECTLDDLYTGNCKQHFNEPATNWKYTKYPKANVLIGYQDNREYIKGVGTTDKSDKLEFEVNVTEVDRISQQGGLGYDQATAKADEKSLSKGDYGSKNVDKPIQKSMQVIKIGGAGKNYAKEFMVLSRSGECDVDFERIAIFYNNNYQILLKLFGNKEKIISENPDYFHLDKANCGNNMVWNTSKDSAIKETFYNDLQSDKFTQGAAFNWNDAFNQITDTVVIEN